jgi:hypothetical protein
MAEAAEEVSLARMNLPPGMVSRLHGRSPCNHAALSLDGQHVENDIASRVTCFRDAVSL